MTSHGGSFPRGAVASGRERQRVDWPSSLLVVGTARAAAALEYWQCRVGAGKWEKSW